MKSDKTIKPTTADVRKLVSGYCETITTKQIAEFLKISTPEAYKLCLLAVEEGWLYRLGYKVPANQGGGYECTENSTRHTSSLTWQNVDDPQIGS